MLLVEIKVLIIKIIIIKVKKKIILILKLIKQIIQIHQSINNQIIQIQVQKIKILKQN